MQIRIAVYSSDALGSRFSVLEAVMPDYFVIALMAHMLRRGRTMNRPVQDLREITSKFVKAIELSLKWIFEDLSLGGNTYKTFMTRARKGGKKIPRNIRIQNFRFPDYGNFNAWIPGISRTRGTEQSLLMSFTRAVRRHPFGWRRRKCRALSRKLRDVEAFF
ncbi:hypothetical protein SERLADRAFT_436091 [Serpula lacrymans var. lacrymans S7.9]|uniref:Uncharacterized protein n=1 Tax=Serpula lacrymans var. lacrymans (strain S7.9) TaxID=578457 RepID=F8NRF2_SERL9|nr:uncharacterized protein SERLADRAFT_436091 [Serpula lacrymans var. lacrymans S7.9]EGO26271.1 hypothetical protein SERLADRAFT_436091 [Serpula lacrymans var. lacrymans S7.9]